MKKIFIILMAVISLNSVAQEGVTYDLIKVFNGEIDTIDSPDGVVYDTTFEYVRSYYDRAYSDNIYWGKDTIGNHEELLFIEDAGFEITKARYGDTTTVNEGLKSCYWATRYNEIDSLFKCHTFRKNHSSPSIFLISVSFIPTFFHSNHGYRTINFIESRGPIARL